MNTDKLLVNGSVFTVDALSLNEFFDADYADLTQIPADLFDKQLNNTCVIPKDALGCPAHATVA